MSAEASAPARQGRPQRPVPWETFPHGADVGVRGYGASMGEAFANAALALTSVITDPALVQPLRRFAIDCAAPDREILFVDWLNQLIWRMASDEMLFGRFEVKAEPEHLAAVVYGEAIDPARHRPAVEVKGATFTELEVAQGRDGRWRAQCVVDV